MPVFNYEGKTKQGALRKGKMEAIDKAAIIAALREIDVYPTNINLYKETAVNVDISQFNKVTLKDIYIFCREFSYIVASGLGIVRAMEILKQQTENPRLRKAINSVSESVQKGDGLSKSMAKHKEFPAMLVSMIEVGEVSGTLEEIMNRMANYYQKEYKLQQKVKQALTYPALVTIFAIIVVNILVIKVLPIFTNMILQNGGSKEQLPLPTKFVMALSNGMRSYWPIILGTIILISVTVKVITKNAKNIEWDKLKLRIPVLGKLNQKVVTAEFARTFGILIASGLPIMKSIEICSDIVGNLFIKNILLSTKGEIEKGAAIGETLESRDVFPQMLTQMIKIGEESGTMDSVLLKTAEFYDGEVEAVTAQLTTMIEPIIIIVLAVVVGFIILSVILPMFQMYNTIGN